MKRPDTSASNFLKLQSKVPSYRLEASYRNPSRSLRTRPNTQISAFSQTFTNGIGSPLEIQRETSEVIHVSKNSLVIPQTELALGAERLSVTSKWKTRPSIDMRINSKKFQNLNLKLKMNAVSAPEEFRPFDNRSQTQIFQRGQYDVERNSIISSKKHKDSSENMNSSRENFNSAELPISGSLIKSLFRQNNLRAVRNSLIQQSAELRRKISENTNGCNSPTLSPKIYKTPNLPEGMAKKKELEIYLNMKNYKLSKTILGWLKNVCENTIKDHPKNADQAFVDKKIVEIYSTLVHHLSNVPTLVTECVNNRDNKEELFTSLTLMTAELMQTRDYGLYVEGLKLQAKIFKIYGDFSKSLQTYTQAMHLCNKHDLYKLKTKIYKRVGKLYLNLQNLRKAKSCFIKALEMAWFVSSKKYELIAYDLLGLIAFYDGAIEKAKYYHNRMLNCELEDQKSAIRLVAISKIKNKIEIRKSMESNFMVETGAASSDEEEVGLYEVKKKKEDFEIYLTKSEAARQRNKGISFGEKQKLLIKQTGSSMFKNKVNIKEEFLPDGVLKKIRKRLQKEREMANLVETSKKTNIHDVLKLVPEEISNAFFSVSTSSALNANETRKYPLDLIKGIYGIKKSIIVTDSQKIENFKFMKTTSINKQNFILSHLSSNRNLDRFSRVFNTNQYRKQEVNNEINLFLDKKTSLKIKKSLVKFKSNIIVALSRLETVKRGKFLSPNNSLYLRRGGLSVN